MENLIEAFFENPPEECGAIYNERSLQLELAYWFRRIGARVEFEYSCPVTVLDGSTCPPKSNLDLLVKKDGVTTAIELKVPLNGQHPETFYNFCKDVAFVEGIVRGRFADRGYCLLVTNDRAFWTDSGRGSPIHNLFRRSGSTLTGVIEKPTGRKNTAIVLSGRYAPADRWRNLRGHRLMNGAQYLLLGIEPETPKG